VLRDVVDDRSSFVVVFVGSERFDGDILAMSLISKSVDNSWQGTKAYDAVAVGADCIATVAGSPDAPAVIATKLVAPPSE
jgi:hypothetical protein